jgi:spore germination cell wall hydrolase CwlJ-like protein
MFTKAIVFFISLFTATVVISSIGQEPIEKIVYEPIIVEELVYIDQQIDNKKEVSPPITKYTMIAEAMIKNFDTTFINLGDEELNCLAMNIYHEARNDLIAGQFAVADVVLNRVADKRFPNTICEVVKDGPVKESWETAKTKDPSDAVYYPVKHKCQFSWYCDGQEDATNEKTPWLQAQAIAAMMTTSNVFRGITEGATHYHAHYVHPRWAKTKYPVGTIGLHKFYKWL